MTDPPSTLPPALGPDDIYVYAHGNGALYVEYPGDRSVQAPLAEVRAIVEGRAAAGGRVYVGGDDAPLAVDALADLGGLGVPLEPFRPPAPPLTWNEGTTALMAAAATGADHLLDDLIARGVPVGETDDGGFAAVHHAAVAGNRHAVEALVAAGASPTDPNGNGDTPVVLAEGWGHHEVAERLRSLVPTHAGNGAGAAHRFARIHLFSVFVWWVPPLLVLVLVAVTWPPGIAIAAAVVAFGVLARFVVPPPPFWAGGAPRRLDGSILTLRRPTGGSRALDLAVAGPVAGIGGSLDQGRSRRPRWVLVAHPDGHPTSPGDLHRLGVPDEDLALLAEGSDRFVVVVVDGLRTDDVLPALVDVLLARGVELTPTLRGEERRARHPH